MNLMLEFFMEAAIKVTLNNVALLVSMQFFLLDSAFSDSEYGLGLLNSSPAYKCKADLNTFFKKYTHPRFLENYDILPGPVYSFYYTCNDFEVDIKKTSRGFEASNEMYCHGGKKTRNYSYSCNYNLKVETCPTKTSGKKGSSSARTDSALYFLESLVNTDKTYQESAANKALGDKLEKEGFGVAFKRAKHNGRSVKTAFYGYRNPKYLGRGLTRDSMLTEDKKTRLLQILNKHIKENHAEKYKDFIESCGSSSPTLSAIAEFGKRGKAAKCIKANLSPGQKVVGSLLSSSMQRTGSTFSYTEGPSTSNFYLDSDGKTKKIPLYGAGRPVQPCRTESVNFSGDNKYCKKVCFNGKESCSDRRNEKLGNGQTMESIQLQHKRAEIVEGGYSNKVKNYFDFMTRSKKAGSAVKWEESERKSSNWQSGEKRPKNHGRNLSINTNRYDYFKKVRPEYNYCADLKSQINDPCLANYLRKTKKHLESFYSYFGCSGSRPEQPTRRPIDDNCQETAFGECISEAIY